MTKEKWIEHIQAGNGYLVPPSKGGNKAAWMDSIKAHKEAFPDCPTCKDRQKTRKAALYRRERDEAMKSLGLTKVKGINGGIYWE